MELSDAILDLRGGFPGVVLRVSLARLSFGDRSDAAGSFYRPRQDTILPTPSIFMRANFNGVHLSTFRC